MLKLSSVFIAPLFFIVVLFAGVSSAQENPYAIETKVIKNEQAIQTLRQQQANLYLKMEDLLVKYGELLGKIQDLTHRLDAVEARLNSLASNSGNRGNVQTIPQQANPYPNASSNQTYSNNIPPAKTLPEMPKKQVNSNVAQNVQKPSSTNIMPKNKNVGIEQKTAANLPKPAQKQKPAVVSDKQIYLAAKKLYDTKRYRAAINAFENFKRQYKKSKYLPNAIFYLAQSHFNIGEYDKAIISYDYLINTYPKSNKIPAALLKEGISFIKLGDNIDGKYLLKKTISSYPNSKEAQIAKKYLKKIK